MQNVIDSAKRSGYWTGWLCAVFALGIFCSTCESARATAVTVQWFGATERVSGSLAVVESGRRRWVIDAGLFYAEGASDPDAQNDEVPKSAISADAIFLTHAHLDHVGRLPALIEAGTSAEIITTPGTRTLLEPMLTQAVRYRTSSRGWTWSRRSVRPGEDGRPYVTAHWRTDCEWNQRIASVNKETAVGRRSAVEASSGLSLRPCEVCTARETEQILRRISTIEYGVHKQLRDQAIATLLDAGHIPGSASVLLDVPTERGRGRLLFSGDLGNGHSELINGPSPAPPVDAIWIESTYGGSEPPHWEDEQQAFRAAVADAVAIGKIVWIPAFALDRTQKILQQLQRAKSMGSLPASVPIYAVSPSGRAITELYENELRSRSQMWFRPSLYSAQPVLARFESTLPDRIPTPSIVVTSSGMMDLGSSAGLLNRLLPRSDVDVFLVGYQDPGSTGGRLREGVLFLESESYTGRVSASVRAFKGFSAHAGVDELLIWLSRLSPATPIRLVHGEQSSLRALSKTLTASGFSDVEVVAGTAPFEVRGREAR